MLAEKPWCASLPAKKKNKKKNINARRTRICPNIERNEQNVRPNKQMNAVGLELFDWRSTSIDWWSINDQSWQTTAMPTSVPGIGAMAGAVSAMPASTIPGGLQNANMAGIELGKKRMRDSNDDLLMVPRLMHELHTFPFFCSQELGKLFSKFPHIFIHGCGIYFN